MKESDRHQPINLSTYKHKQRVQLYCLLPIACCLLLTGCSGGGGGGGGTEVTGNGQIQITSQPSEASIFLNGTDTGKVTPSTLDVSAGTHKLKLTKLGRLWEKDVVVKSGQVLPVEATLDYTSTAPPI